MIERKIVRFEKDDMVIEGVTYLIPPNSFLGYNCGYSIFVPKDCDKNTTLIMHSCNTGRNVPIHLKEANDIAKKSTYELNLGMLLGSDLKMPVMIPIIPRIQGFSTQALGSRAFHNDVSTLVASQKGDNREEIARIQEQCRDIPMQVANMIKSSKLFLKSIGITVDDKVIIEGYSSGSKFANRFMALHPELVKACICGGNSGLGILPLSEYKGQKLSFPLGISDIPDFDYEAFCQIPQLYYIGTEDYNDPAMYKCNFRVDSRGNFLKDAENNLIPVTDVNGRIIPILGDKGQLQPRYPDSYTEKEIAQIHNLLGENPQTRFIHNETIYNALGVNAIFKKFPGTHNTVTQNHSGTYIYTNECIKDFIRKVISKEKSLDASSKNL